MARDRFEERWRKKQDDHVRSERPSRSRRRPARSPLEVASERFGLEVKTRALLDGWMSGLRVSVRWRLGEESTWRATIKANRLPADLALFAETALTVMKKSITGEDVLTFDREFDRLVSVHGPALETIALLDHQARKHIIALLLRGFHLRGQRIDLEWTTRPHAAPSREHALELRRAVALGRRMSLDNRPIGSRLLRNARRDPVMSVRVNSLALLLSHARDQSKIPLPRETMVEIAALALHEQDPDAASLSRTALVETAIGVLERAPMRANDLDRFSQRGLLALFAVAKGDMKLSAIEALGRAGGPAAIDAMLPLSSGFFVRSAVKTAVRKAIAEIEKRAGSDRGRLSVVPFAASGSLALASGDGGLALSDEDDDDDDDDDDLDS